MHRQLLPNLMPHRMKRLILLMLALIFGISSQPLAANSLVANHQLFLPHVSTPEPRDQATVGYATGADRTLVRWFCSSDCATQYELYRSMNGGSPQFMAIVGRESNAADAVLTLNTTDPRWPNLYDDLRAEYQDQQVSDIATLFALLDENPIVAQKLANEYYPVALIYGWGYLDSDITPGATYSYQVVRTSDSALVGTVELLAGQLTPLPAPQNVQALELAPAAGELTHAKNADWGSVQADRRFHQSAYLRWDVGAPEIEGYPAAWTIGYDIYRAPSDDPADLAQVNGEISVQPIAAATPAVAASAVVRETATAADYQLIEHFYADRTDVPGTYQYRVAPRDALGQVRQWPADNSQFSAAVPVTTYDFQPPPPPQEFQATVNADHTAVTLSWDMPTPPADLAGFRIEHTTAFSNSIPVAECGSAADCWAEIATLGASVRQWIDPNPQQAQARWYRVQAVDSAGNRSMYSMPLHATLHDVAPPAKPLINLFPCAKDPNDTNPEYCIEAEDGNGGGNSDVTRYLVACTFEQGGAEIFLFERAAANGAMPPFAITTLYDPPFALQQVECTVRAVDANGNISEPSQPAVIDEWHSEQPQLPRNPLLTKLSTVALDADGNATAEISWDMPESPLIASFSLSRRLIAEDGPLVEITGINRSARSYNDTTVRAGELYSYVVSAELVAPFDALDSEPRFYRAVSDGRRPLARFDLSNLSWNAAAGTSIAWNACPAGTPLDGDFRFAIFRSIAQNQDYSQITPIFSTSGCAASYVDNSAQHDRYFYSVMQFNPRSGEPIGFSDPVRVSGLYIPDAGSNLAVPAGQGLVQSSIYNPGLQILVPNCTPISPVDNDYTQPLRFGDGFEVHDLNVVPTATTIAGSGTLRVFNNGALVNIPVTFNNITLADAQNRVCSGGLTADLSAAPIVVTPADGFSYRVEQLVLRPFFANINQGSGKLRMMLPLNLRAVDLNGDESDMLALAGPQLRIDANLDFSFQTNIDQIANHGCAAGEDPILAFSLETMPALIVPSGSFRVTPAGVEMAGSCMDYAERYNPLYAAGSPRPAFGNLNEADSNDGFLRARYSGALNSSRITPDGLEGRFATAAPLSYVASYPYGFNIELTGDKSLDLAESRIAGGSLGSGSATFSYARTLIEVPSQQVTVNFSNLTVDAGGGLYATVIPATAAVEWMLPKGFVTGLLNTELYLGQLTSDQRPGQIIDAIATSALWAGRPGDSLDLGLGQPSGLEPGLNLRRANHTLLWQQCPAGLAGIPVTADSYMRHGGISDRFQAQIETSFAADIHGYASEIDTFDLSFIDNFIYDSDIRGDLELPFPADLNLRFISMWFDLGGCIGGGELLNTFENLEYWNTNVNLNHAEFVDEGDLPDLAGYPNWDRVLRTIGALELPHLSLPGQEAPALLGVKIGFQPDGNPYEQITLDVNRPIFEFDGFPLLLSGLRLSNLNEPADWDANATAANAPATNWAVQGFVEVQGGIAAPYFGLLIGESEQPGQYPEIRMQLHNDYVGFDEQLKGARVWVDLPIVQVVHEFRNLVYASSEQEGHGLLIGFREYEFLPDVAITALNLPDEAKVVHMDVAVIMEPQHVHFFLGQSSGVAVFRALAEAGGTIGDQAPGIISMNLWAGRMAMSPQAVEGYRNLTTSVWPSFAGIADGDFRSTSEALNQFDLLEDQSLPDNNTFGGGTLGYIEQAGVDFNKIRGQVEVDGIGAGMQLEYFQAATEFKVQPDDSIRAILEADLANFTIERNGDYRIYGQNVGSVLVGNKLAFDITGLYNAETQLWEIGGGIHEEVGLFHNLESWNVNLNKLNGAGAFGGASGINYFGAQMEASWNFIPFRATSFGGQILIGTIDPELELLQAHFPDVLEHLHLVPAAPNSNEPATILKGGYLRLYGDMSSNRKVAKVFTVNGGARLGGWYWADQAGGAYYGGLAGAFVHTNYLKVLSARGDMTFSYAHTPTADYLTAEAWVAGGIGSCEPETWTSWAGRWWNDRWCWAAGAQTELSYNLAEDDFDASWQFDFE
ncbi:MAG: hypothetical protein HC822_12915 [Oscillochloris sp.]|nr:hypothetical protein [Oscillochloris sp.]